MNKNRIKLAAADIAQCGLFVALMVVAAFIKIPFPTLPLTLQTAVAITCGFLLGWRKGIITTSIYAIVGLCGVPVFASAPYGGFGCALTPSFGFVIGFIILAGIAGLGGKLCPKLWQKIILSLVALISSYLVGTAYFIAVWVISGYAGLWQAVATSVLVYLPKDIILCVLAALLAQAVLPVLGRMYTKK